MGWGDRMHAVAGRLHVRGRDAAGRATGSDRIKAEGKAHHFRADLRQAGGKLKDVFRKH